MDPGLEDHEASLQLLNLVFRQPIHATRNHATASFRQGDPQIDLRGSTRDVVKRPEQSQTDRNVRFGIMSDLLERRVEEFFERNPRYNNAHDVRR